MTREVSNGTEKEIDYKTLISGSVFTEKEIKEIIKGFIKSYLEGSISIEFPTAEEIIEQEEFKKIKISGASATDREIKIKESFTNLILICSGVTKTTPEGQEQAFARLFKMIFMMKNSKRIKGKFVEHDVFDRVAKLEEGMDKTNTLIKEVIEFLTGKENE